MSRTRRDARVLYFTGPREVTVRSEAIRTPGPSEVLIESERSGISSGTERLVYRNEAPPEMEADAELTTLEGTLSFPLSYGYALVGRVTEVGDEVGGDWTGRRVFAFHPHASRAVVPADELLRVPDSCSAREAAMLPTVETAVNLILDARPRLGERVLVLGQGVVGLATTGLLGAFPLEHLVTSDRYERRRRVSRELGATATVDPDRGTAALREPLSAGDRYDLVLECTGRPEALDAAVEVAGFDGRIVVGSWYGTRRAELDLGGRFHRDRIRIVSSQVSTLAPDLRGRWTKERRLSTAWRAAGRLDLDRLVTHEIPFSEAARAYRLLDERPERALQIVLDYSN